MIVLGIETSCDETAVAIVSDDRQILANRVFSQLKEHENYGGVVPEIAARSHIKAIKVLLDQALGEAKIGFEEIDAIAVTAGPGLIGGVLVGSMFAKGLAARFNKPLIAVNHLEGHALTAGLTNEVTYPFLLLLVSGGHCQLLSVEGHGNYQILGGTIDDAVGEAFDKIAKMLGLGYPGGPIIEQKALRGNPKAFKLPMPLINERNCNFSFSGLKTAVKRIVESAGNLNEQFIVDISASFQYTVGEILKAKLCLALTKVNTDTVVVAGGVAANQYLKNVLAAAVAVNGCRLITPPIELCTDNAAMIAWAGVERFKRNKIDGLTFVPRSRWPLTEVK